MFRTLALAFLLAGVVFITIGYTKMSSNCPPPRVEYRYIPRKIYEEQIYDQDVMFKFNDMFTKGEVIYNNDGNETIYNTKR